MCCAVYKHNLAFEGEGGLSLVVFDGGIICMLCEFALLTSAGELHRVMTL